MTILGHIDERFFRHRVRSTSYGGMAGVVVAAALFFYHYFADHVLSWELFAVIATMAVVKLGFMAWFYATQ